MISTTTTNTNNGGFQVQLSCLTENPIDDYLRCDPNWANNRQRLTDCAIGFSQVVLGGKGGQIHVVTDSFDHDPTNPTPTLDETRIERGVGDDIDRSPAFLREKERDREAEIKALTSFKPNPETLVKIEALTSFKFNLHNPLSSLNSWDSSTPSNPCDWRGVACYNSRVSELRLARLQLVGPLLTQIDNKLLD